LFIIPAAGALPGVSIAPCIAADSCPPPEAEPATHANRTCEPIAWAAGPLNVTQLDPLFGYVYVDVMDCVDMAVNDTRSVAMRLRPW
jgi:hypothetical protein